MDFQTRFKKHSVAAAALLLLAAFILAAWLITGLPIPTSRSPQKSVATATFPDAGAIIIGGRIRRPLKTQTLMASTWATIRRWCGYGHPPKVSPPITIVEEEDTLLLPVPSLLDARQSADGQTG